MGSVLVSAERMTHVDGWLAVPCTSDPCCPLSCDLEAVAGFLKTSWAGSVQALSRNPVARRTSRCWDLLHENIVL